METRLIRGGEQSAGAGGRRGQRGARVTQGGGNERLESSLPDKVREAAAASLVRLFHKFNDADDHRWSKVIERARAGAEHPLAVLDYSGKTEEHPVCAAVLALVGAGKRGRDVRSHFSDPPYGWPRDAIDAALISLFGTGHLRATANGVALHPPQLDQAKVPSTDFRTESATINARQRLKLRSLFQTAGIDCKPNEETVAAGRLLSRLGDLALNAGGDAPLPKRPDTQHLSELLALAGNEQLLAILDRHDALVANLNEWTAARMLADERLLAFQRLEALARHANGLDAATDVAPQMEAIVADCRLLDASDPVPGLAAKLTDALRSVLVQSQERHNAVYEEERQRLEKSDGWQKIDQETRDEILSRMHIAKVSAEATGTEREVLESLECISLDGWRTRTAALPRLFAGRAGRSGPTRRAEDPPPEAGKRYPAHPAGREGMDQADRAAPVGSSRARSHRDRLTEEDEPCSSTASRLTNLLSFGPGSQELELEPLNVLIGPNGSGKSNLIEAIGLLQAAPRDLHVPIREGGGVRDWIWRGDKAGGIAEVEVVLPYGDNRTLRYTLAFLERDHRFRVNSEELRPEHPDPADVGPTLQY